MTATLHPRDRRAAIVDAMTGPEGLLRRYRPSTHLDETLRAAEARDLIEDLDAALPGDLTASELAAHLDGTRRALRRAWGGPWWPTSLMLVEAAQEAAQAHSAARGADAALGWLSRFYTAHGRPLAGVATPERTSALIRRGVLSAREARHAGFPLTDYDDAEARRQLPCAAEVASAIRCRARLRGITEDVARAELVATGEIPGHRIRGAAA